jgi:hypothetical protein
MRFMIRTYSELQHLRTLSDRYDYLRLGGTVGATTFGFDRWINQMFYRSNEWKQIRNHVIARDQGLDLGTEDVPLMGAHLIHHMNPITLEDIEDATDNLLDPEFLITTSLKTHNAIHYGDESQLPRPFVPREPGDTRLW